MGVGIELLCGVGGDDGGNCMLVGVFSCWPWHTLERRKDIDDLTDLGGALLLHTRRDAVRSIMHHSERYCMTQIETGFVLNNLVGVHVRCGYLMTMPFDIEIEGWQVPTYFFACLCLLFTPFKSFFQPCSVCITPSHTRPSTQAHLLQHHVLWVGDDRVDVLGLALN